MNSASEPASGTPSSRSTTSISDRPAAERTTCAPADDRRVGADLRQHALPGDDRHHQQMLDRTLLALANQRGSAEDDGEHGQTIDDLYDRVEPAWHHVGIEHASDDQIDRCFAAAFTPSSEVVDLVR